MDDDGEDSDEQLWEEYEDDEGNPYWYNVSIANTCIYYLMIFNWLIFYRRVGLTNLLYIYRSTQGKLSGLMRTRTRTRVGMNMKTIAGGRTRWLMGM